MATFRTANYSDYLNDMAALIGVDQGDFQTTELTFLNSFFNKNIRDIWERQNWTDICPYAETRFPTNQIHYPNDYTQSSWSTFQTTVNAGSTVVIQNPLDVRINCQAIYESISASNHYIQQNQTPSLQSAFIPTYAYQYSFYARPNGRNYVWIYLNDGATSALAFYNILTGQTGTVTAGTSSNVSVGCQQINNGFSLCSITFTASSSATTSGYIQIGISPDGVNTNYAGTGTVGIYLWGVTGSQNYLPAPANFYIPMSQAGETAIDQVFDCWCTNPTGFLPGNRSSYQLTQYGLQLIGAQDASPVYLYYRQQRPLFTGSAYSSSTSYTSGQTFYYTSTAYGSAANYFQATTTTSAGQTPDSASSSFSVLSIPYVLYQYVVNMSYADWLEVEGQSMKAQAARQTAQMYLDNENDKQERQSGNIMPWRVSTHLTSQNRGMGYQGQNFNPGTATID